MNWDLDKNVFMNATAADESQLRSLLSAAERAEMQGQMDEATRLLSAARTLAPEHPAVLGAAGTLALRKGDAAQAKALLERSLAADSTNAGLLLNLASSLRALNDATGELKALDQALSRDPYFFQALIQKGSLLERLGKPKEAAQIYQRALNAIPPGSQLPRAWQPYIEYAQKAVAANLRQLDVWLSAKMSEVRSHFGPDDQERVNDCLGAVLGRNRIYVSQPTYTHFPRLPAIQFFDRKDFPWVPEMEAATDDIRAELLGMLQHARGNFVPYLQHGSDEPLNQWRELNRSLRWSALFLYKDGQPQPENIARCPKTVAALAQADVVNIPNRGPTSFFSLLEPKTHIPAHTGTTNIRLTVHIPLIVPPQCRFRVGTQTREWSVGTAFLFDDTIEHEAWNDSDEERVILIFDVWNPLLSKAERELMTVATAAIADFYAEP